MAKYVLAADYTLMTDYRNVPLATFFSCIPTDYWQSRLVFRILADQPKLDAQGRPIRVPYGLRKVEASLVRAFGRDDVVIADPRDVTATSTTRQRSSDCIRWILSASVP